MAERASAHLWKGRAMPLTSAQLVEQVEAAARVIFAPRPFPLATREVKTFFGDLGRSLDFRICASGYKGADDGEWLYDLVWFESDEEGFMIRQRRHGLHSAPRWRSPQTRSRRQRSGRREKLRRDGRARRITLSGIVD